MNCLRLVRNQQGYTLKDLALKTGIPFQRIASLEKGEIKYRSSDIERLEEVLKIKLFSITDEDQEILDLFNNFVEALFIGEDELSGFKEAAIRIQEIELNSKYLYVLPLIIYIIDQIEGTPCCDDEVSKYIYDDEKAGCLYLIYKANENPSEDYKKSLNTLEEVLKIVSDTRLKALAYYELCFVYIYNYQLHDALKCIDIANDIFTKGNAYIRCYNCDILKSMALVYYGEYKQAINIIDNCFKIVDRLNLPSSHVARLLRNKALYHIYNKEYEKALNTLNKSLSYDKNSNLVIMYYIYAYSLSKQYDKADHWLFKAQMKFTDKDMLLELDFWKSYVKNKNDIPNDKLFIKSRRIVDKFIKDKFYEGYFFYSDILCSLYERAKDFENAYYLKKDRDFLLNNLKNS